MVWTSSIFSAFLKSNLIELRSKVRITSIISASTAGSRNNHDGAMDGCSAVLMTQPWNCLISISYEELGTESLNTADINRLYLLFDWMSQDLSLFSISAFSAPCLEISFILHQKTVIGQSGQVISTTRIFSSCDDIVWYHTYQWYIDMSLWRGHHDPTVLALIDTRNVNFQRYKLSYFSPRNNFWTIYDLYLTISINSPPESVNASCIALAGSHRRVLHWLL